MPATLAARRAHIVQRAAVFWSIIVAAGLVVRFLLPSTAAAAAQALHAARVYVGSAFGPAMLVSLGMWLVFSVYWDMAARGAAPRRSAESLQSRRLHQLLVNAGRVLVFLPLPLLRTRFLPEAMAVALTGLAIQAACLGLAMWARRSLGSNWSIAIATRSDHDLVCSGPYRILRHPIYSALVGMYAGTALVSGEIHALMGCAVFVIAYRRKLRLEEQHLRHVFGAAYADYSRRTWRLVPGVY